LVSSLTFRPYAGCWIATQTAPAPIVIAEPAVGARYEPHPLFTRFKSSSAHSLLSF